MIYSGCLFMIIKAASTPGIHPSKVSTATIIIDPHPRSKTAKGGKIIATIALKIDIKYSFYISFTNIIVLFTNIMPKKTDSNKLGSIFEKKYSESPFQ